MITLTEREEFLSDILDTAISSIVYYWATVVSYNHEEGCKPSAIIENPEDDEPEFYHVDLDLIDEGLQIAKEKYSHFSDILNEAEGNLDAGDIDAEIADVIFQCAIFNEIVYG